MNRPTPQEEVRMTDIQLYLEDCLNGMRQLPTASIDLVVTSPPYNLGIQYNVYNDGGERATYLKWTSQWAAEVKRVLREDASFFLNVGAAPANPFLPHEIVLELRHLFYLQ